MLALTERGQREATRAEIVDLLGGRVKAADHVIQSLRRKGWLERAPWGDNYGIPLPHDWTTQNNGAKFGTDYFTRAAVAKSNIFVNAPNETKYFYQDFDDGGQQLNGSRSYTVTFASGGLPPVKGFWSLTLYNQHHFFSPNEIKRYSVGTKSKTLVKTRTARLRSTYNRFRLKATSAPTGRPRQRRTSCCTSVPIGLKTAS